MTLGGLGIIGGVSQTVGGTLSATGDIVVDVSGGTVDVSFTMNTASILQTQTAINEADGADHNIAIHADQDIQVYSAIEALQPGADVTLISGELIFVDGLLKADDQLTVIGGSDEMGAGVIVNAFVFDTNGGRLQGGTLTTNPGGTIIMGAGEKLVLSGVVGEVHDVAGVPVADTSELHVTHAGNVMVMTSLNAANLIRFQATDITLAPDSVIQTRAAGGVVDLRATGNFLIAAELPGTQPALILGDALLHLAGGMLSLDGQILDTSATGRIVINAVDSVTFFGEVNATDSLEVRAGVGANWTDAQLLGAVNVADLSGGDVTINGGTLTSGGEASIVAGNNVTVVGSTSVGSDPDPVQRPIIVTTSRTIEIITGSRQVAIGVIEVPEVTFVTTTTTEQVGTESVRVGSLYNTADVTLTQLGYYNPDAVSGAQARKYFFEGIDYQNSNVDWSVVYDELTGDIIPLADAEAGTGKEYGNLSDNQTDSVLIHLGYRSFYNVSFANLISNSTINGIAAEVPWHPSWEGDLATVTLDTGYIDFSDPNHPGGIARHGGLNTYQQYNNTTTRRLSIDGWRDKYVQMPVGAESDILRVVSLGVPVVLPAEFVGRVRDSALVFQGQLNSFANAGFPAPREQSVGQPGSGHVGSYYSGSPRWRTTFHSDAHTQYEIFDERTLRIEGTRASNAGGSSVRTDSNNRSVAGQKLTNGTVLGDRATSTLTQISQFNRGATVGWIATQLPTVPFYRLIKPGVEHLWTTNVAERDNLIQFHGYILEEGAPNVFPVQQPGTVPFYRLRGGGGHLWTTNTSERDTLIHSHGYIDEGVAAFVFPNQPSNTIPLWRVVHLGSGEHLWTTNTLERDDLIYLHGFTDEGVAAYVPASADYWIGNYVGETQNDFLMRYNTHWEAIYDTRLQLSYQMVTNPTDVFDLRPKFETGESTVKVVNEKSVTQWQTENIVESQTFLTTSRELEDGPPALQGAFSEPSIIATSAVNISAGNDMTVQAIVQSSGIDQTLAITAGQDVLIDGIAPDGAPQGHCPPWPRCWLMGGSQSRQDATRHSARRVS